MALILISHQPSVEPVDRAGLRRETLFLFSSDNGGPNPGRVTSNGPLRGAKATLYEGSVRVPASVTWEGHVRPGSVVEAPLHAVDWYPTLLGLAGGSSSQSLPIDGRDAWPAIVRVAPSPHVAILLNTSPRAGAIRVGDWKLIARAKGADDRDDVQAAEGTASPPKPAAEVASMTAELFHLADDPYERHDLAKSKPEKVAELRARYAEFARQAVPPRMAPKAPGFRTPRVWGAPE